VSRPFVIVGAGALGQSFAALLARSGQAVTLFATPRSTKRLRAAGWLSLRGALDVDVPLTDLRVTCEPSDVPPEAIAIFTTKGQDLPGAIDALGSDRVAWAAGVQNGIVKDDVLCAAFGAERVVAAATIFSASRQEDGSVRVMSRGMTYFGELNGRPSERTHAVMEAFVAAGIPTQARTDIHSVLWSKACNATGVFGICALARATNPRLFSDPDLMRAYLTLVRETAAVAAAYGAPVGNYAGFPPIGTYAESDEQSILAGLPPRPVETEPSYASMTADLLAGRPMEVESIFGDIVERADQRGIAVPCLRFTRDVLRGLNHERIPDA
jgi:2-dehydropantoate 2-reductase